MKFSGSQLILYFNSRKSLSRISSKGQYKFLHNKILLVANYNPTLIRLIYSNGLNPQVENVVFTHLMTASPRLVSLSLAPCCNVSSSCLHKSLKINSLQKNTKNQRSEFLAVQTIAVMWNQIPYVVMRIRILDPQLAPFISRSKRLSIMRIQTNPDLKPSHY